MVEKEAVHKGLTTLKKKKKKKKKLCAKEYKI